MLKDTHKAIKNVTECLDTFAFNKAVAHLYELTNALSNSKANPSLKKYTIRILAQLMQPITPHLCQEIWCLFGSSSFVSSNPWPEAISELIESAEVVYPIQINGKRRAEIVVPKDLDSQEIEQEVLALTKVQNMLNGSKPKKVIIVPGRIVNVVL